MSGNSLAPQCDALRPWSQRTTASFGKGWKRSDGGTEQDLAICHLSSSEIQFFKSAFSGPMDAVAADIFEAKETVDAA